MKTSEIIHEFNNSVRELAGALGITREAVYQWGEDVPQLRAYQIKEILAKRAKVSHGETPPGVEGAA
jgi:hypothetical protein